MDDNSVTVESATFHSGEWNDNSLTNSFWKLVKYVKRAVPCEKFDHFFYFFKFFFVYLLKEVDFFS